MGLMLYRPKPKQDGKPVASKPKGVGRKPKPKLQAKNEGA